MGISGKYYIKPGNSDSGTLGLDPSLQCLYVFSEMG